MDVVGVIMFLEAENKAGVEAAVMRMSVFEAGQEIRRGIPQRKKASLTGSSP